MAVVPFSKDYTLNVEIHPLGLDKMLHTVTDREQSTENRQKKDKPITAAPLITNGIAG